MKKIIDGVLYDTKTAPMLGDWDNRIPTNDFGYCYEGLYKQGNQYFLYGKGGALSKYSEQAGNHHQMGGSTITLLTEAEARHWAEEHLDADDYMAIFAVDKHYFVEISEEAFEKLEQVSIKNIVPKSEILSKLINVL